MPWRFSRRPSLTHLVLDRLDVHVDVTLDSRDPSRLLCSPADAAGLFDSLRRVLAPRLDDLLLATLSADRAASRLPSVERDYLLTLAEAASLALVDELSSSKRLADASFEFKHADELARTAMVCGTAQAVSLRGLAQEALTGWTDATLEHDALVEVSDGRVRLVVLACSALTRPDVVPHPVPPLLTPRPVE